MHRDPESTKDLLDALVAGIRDVLGDRLWALYLYGSFVSGGFDPGISDVDLIAVTASRVEALDLGALGRMHRALVGRYPEWSNRVEVVYVARATLRSFRTSRGALAVISPGEPLHLRSERASKWLQNWYLARATGVTLLGPDPATTIPPIEPTEFVDATSRYARDVHRRGIAESGGGSVAYTILTLCRALQTVSTGMPASKQDGAAWVRERMPDWAWLIDSALECRRTRGTTGLADDRSRSAAATLIGLLADEIARVHPI